MTPKEYLNQYRDSMERTSSLEQHLNELKVEAIRLKDHDGRSVALDSAVARYVDACDSAASELDDLETLRVGILATIDRVQNKKLRTLLNEVYINGKKLVQIAAERDQSYEHICRLHGDALNAVRAVRSDLN